MPSRVIVHGVEGVGKSSFGAFAPDSVFLMARGETGIQTLISSGQVPETDHFPELQTWDELLAVLEFLETGVHSFRSVVLDTLNGFERICHEHVCLRNFGGDWGKSGFASYQQGYDVSLADWRDFLSRLDRLRTSRQIAVIGLCHTKVTTFKNPEGSDYDRYQPDLHHKTWSLTHKWADVVVFANFETFLSEDGKGVGGTKRILHTERTAAWDAKNRHGLAAEIDMGNSGNDAWTNFRNAIKGSK
ncbi:MAG: ATP-binding protein [Geminicoccaceae bacterium]